MSGHIVRTFIIMPVIWGVFRHRFIKMAFKIHSYGRICIFIDCQTCGGMGNEQVADALLRVETLQSEVAEGEQAQQALESEQQRLAARLAEVLADLDEAQTNAALEAAESSLGATHPLVAEVPITYPERHQGLSGRPGLEPGRAMLFYSKRPQVFSMHMRGMQFSLDFLWASSGRVSGVTPNVPPAHQGLLKKLVPR